MTKTITFFVLLISNCSFGQSFTNRAVMGKEYATQRVNEAITNKDYKPFYDTLIKTKETAIAIAEPILFSIYRKEEIISERPYECYLINGYWYISGTLDKNMAGGVFEIILNSKDGRVLKVIHGK